MCLRTSHHSLFLSLSGIFVGKKTASKTKKQGDNLNVNWDRGSGFVKQWNYDRGSKKKKGYHHEDEGKLKKYNKAYKAENNQLKKGHHLKYKKHNAGYKNAWVSDRSVKKKRAISLITIHFLTGQQSLGTSKR